MNKLYMFLCLLPAVLGAHVDLSTYTLSQVLRDSGGETYTLHWGFNVEEETIRFAVNVSTLGWVGLGLSANGRMANSDVVIGWVNDNGDPFLHDRFATGESQPPVDAEQNWFLDGGEEENGHTILAFRRDWVTCDAENDRDVKVETARVIFSWNEADPINDDPNGVAYHGTGNRGSVSINLLGAPQEVPPDPADVQTFHTVVDNINIPASDTTYWCSVHEIPSEVQAQTHYITKVSPVITEGNEANVHHILVYECDGLSHNESGVCAGISVEVNRCLRGTLVAGWAVGGAVFYYPQDVAYPFGGSAGPRFFVMETHYDNPDIRPDIFDSSGLAFSYTATQRRFDAGILQVGHDVNALQIIPPGVSMFNTFGECNSQCTNKYFPEDGITVFGNLLHTHLAGVGLTLHHYRRVNNSQGCSGVEELEPIEQNLQYDFNYQQYTTLTTPIQVMPGDTLRLECNYNTTSKNTTTLGGFATSDEMCLSYLAYYPQTDLYTCLSTPTQALLLAFSQNLTRTEQITFLSTLQLQGPQSAWNTVQWTPERVAAFEETIQNGEIVDICIPSNQELALDRILKVGLSEPDCEYQAPDQCVDSQPPDISGAPVVSASAMLITIYLGSILALL